MQCEENHQFSDHLRRALDFLSWNSFLVFDSSFPLIGDRRSCHATIPCPHLLLLPSAVYPGRLTTVEYKADTFRSVIVAPVLSNLLSPVKNLCLALTIHPSVYDVYFRASCLSPTYLTGQLQQLSAASYRGDLALPQEESRQCQWVDWQV